MIFLITGIMASGKSTVGELLAQNFPKSVHLRGDVFRKMMVKGRVEMSEDPTPEALYQLDLRTGWRPTPPRSTTRRALP